MVVELDPAQATSGEQMLEFNILSVTVDGLGTTLNLNLPLSIGLALVVLAVSFLLRKISLKFKGFSTDEITVKEPFTGTEVKIKANTEDKKIAHRIWTELITRKAAIPFQRDKDVIVEVYDSWHTLFQCVREQISAIPVEKLRGREKVDIEQLIDISTKVLNDGLRPHLTEWQAKYRTWYSHAQNEEQYSELTPQELQRKYPLYDELVSDIESVNSKLSVFAHELKKIVRS
ncbi:hypothetical protein AB4427_14495 [Vibrio artabrorum]|uniref:hypothetical protein n=1 Tax=Vibrio artabrorum TaxID=446374 RepID=UPI00354F90E6